MSLFNKELRTLDFWWLSRDFKKPLTVKLGNKSFEVLSKSPHGYVLKNHKEQMTIFVSDNATQPIWEKVR